MTIYAATGWLATVWLLVSYWLFVEGHAVARGWRYLLLNIIGTLIMMIDMIHRGIWWMVVFQGAWIWISLRGIYNAHFPRKIQQEKS